MEGARYNIWTSKEFYWPPILPQLWDRSHPCFTDSLTLFYKVSPVVNSQFLVFIFSCISAWSEMEELVLSGNGISSLPNTIPQSWPHLRVLRLHSNHLTSCPSLYLSSSLRVSFSFFINGYSVLTKFFFYHWLICQPRRLHEAGGARHLGGLKWGNIK